MKKIEIKPNDKSLVGTKLRLASWDKNDYFLVLYVGERLIFGVTERSFVAFISKGVNGSFPYETAYPINEIWYLYEEPKTHSTASAGTEGTSEPDFNWSKGATSPKKLLFTQTLKAGDLVKSPGGRVVVVKRVSDEGFYVTIVTGGEWQRYAHSDEWQLVKAANWEKIQEDEVLTSKTAIIAELRKELENTKNGRYYWKANYEYLVSKLGTVTARGELLKENEWLKNDRNLWKDAYKREYSERKALEESNLKLDERLDACQNSKEYWNNQYLNAEEKLKKVQEECAELLNNYDWLVEKHVKLKEKLRNLIDKQ